GAKAPDLSSAAAFKNAMLGAKLISYVDPKAGGTSGTYIAGLFQKMGIAQEMQSKTVFRNQGSEVADAVAKGDAEIGITFTSEMITNKGVKLAGTLPDAIQLPTIYAGAVPAGAPNGHRPPLQLDRPEFHQVRSPEFRQEKLHGKRPRVTLVRELAQDLCEWAHPVARDETQCLVVHFAWHIRHKQFAIRFAIVIGLGHRNASVSEMPVI
ncbi:MAG: hypothetical protein DMG14_25230, partial [Acidobacteria bacterium]